VKKLPEHAPETPKTTLLLGRAGGAGCGGHRSILTQNLQADRHGDAMSLNFGPGKREPTPYGRIGDNGAKVSCIKLFVGLK